MAKVIVRDLAKELNMDSKEIMAMATEKGYGEFKSSSKGLEEDQAEAIRRDVKAKKAPKAEVKAEAPKAEAPKAEAPKAEAPKAEAPKAETQTVKAENSKTVAPAAENNKAADAAQNQQTQGQPKKKKVISIVMNNQNGRPANNGQNRQGGQYSGGQYGNRQGNGYGNSGNYGKNNNNSRQQQNFSARPLIKPLTQPSPTPTVQMVPENKPVQKKPVSQNTENTVKNVTENKAAEEMPKQAEMQNANVAEVQNTANVNNTASVQNTANIQNQSGAQNVSRPAGNDRSQNYDKSQNGERRQYSDRPQNGERRQYSDRSQNGERNQYQNRNGQNQGSVRDNRGQNPQGNRQMGDRRPAGGTYQGNGQYQSRQGGTYSGRQQGQSQGQQAQRPYRQGQEGVQRDNRSGYSGSGNGRSFNNSGRDSRPNERQGAGFGGSRNQRGFQNSEAASPIPSNEKGRASRRDKSKDRDHRKEINYDEEQQLNSKKAGRFIKPEKKEEVVEEVIKVITLPETITIKDLADKMKQTPSTLIKKLFLEGKMVTVNDEVSYEEAENIAMEYDILCEHEVKVDVIAELLKEDEEAEENLVERPPVVCVMGHVDHGKTSLLDAIRKTRVTDREAGGITQAIGAYTVEAQGRKITFLDTPGHEAFTAMRMRGANATDIAILVVAADDGVMPQTVEAINHAKTAGVEIIVAVNKIDKPSANVDKVKQELSEYGLISEDWGGSTVFAPVSAKTGEGISNLLDMILLTADVMELKANPDRTARGLVIEAELDKGRGPVATVLVQKGTLHVGDFISAGAAYGKVRAMINDKGQRVKEASPSMPVEILGLSDVPEAGEVFLAHDSDKTAKSFAETYKAQNKVKKLEEIKGRMSLEDLFSKIKEGNLKELNIIVKADVQGSVEAVQQSLTKLSNEEVVVKCIHGGVGAINESDVTLASAANAIIIGFNVRPDATAKATAEQENVDVRLYDVIYKAIEDIELAMKGLLDPIYEEKVIGHAEIRQIFKASQIGNIAGSYVLDGVIQRGCKIRITREGEQIYEGTLASLKRFKDDAKEVKEGFECGLVFEGFDKMAEFDQVEAYIMVEVPR